MPAAKVSKQSGKHRSKSKNTVTKRHIRMTKAIKHALKTV